MTQVRAALFRVVLVVFLTVLALIVFAPVSQRELDPQMFTPQTAAPAVPFQQEQP